MNLRRIGLIGLFLPLWGFAQDPSILINHQGLSQQDLSIRGSSYAGTGVSLNGVNLKVPFSAHYQTDLPLYGPVLSDAERATGLDTVSGGLAGTAAYTVQPMQPQSTSSLGIGTKERYRASAFGSTGNIGGYLDAEKARRIDYSDNDLERLTGGAVAQIVRNDWQIDILSAAQTKRYGARGYYGIPSGIYAKERTDDVLVYMGANKGELDGSFIRTGIGLREFDHEYRIPSSDFENDVRSRYGSLMLEGRTIEIQHIALNLRTDLEHERVSGDIGRHDRTRGSVLILPEARLERFGIRAGLNSVFQTDESPEWLPQAGIDIFPADNLKLYASYAETVQQPDYQTLYYTDPYHIGNDRLKLQKVHHSELGLHQFVSARLDWGVSAFHRRQKHAMDWTQATSAGTAWAATDIGKLDALGADATLNYRATEDLNLRFYYQWVEKDDYPFYAGLYELDYPEHLLGFSGHWRVAPEFLLFAVQHLRYQTDNNVRNGNDFGAEASLGLHYDPRFAKNVRLSFLVENLWGSDFQAVPGLKPRPASFFTGIIVVW